MSAGHFDYIQHKLDDVIEELFLISQSKNYTRPTLERIETAAKTLHMANKVLNKQDKLILALRNRLKIDDLLVSDKMLLEITDGTLVRGMVEVKLAWVEFVDAVKGSIRNE